MRLRAYMQRRFTHCFRHERSHTCRRSVTSRVSEDQGRRRERPAGQTLLGDEVQKASNSVVIHLLDQDRSEWQIEWQIVLARAYPELASARVGSCFSRSTRPTCSDGTLGGFNGKEKVYGSIP
jgi:hypothetical protein